MTKLLLTASFLMGYKSNNINYISKTLISKAQISKALTLKFRTVEADCFEYPDFEKWKYVWTTLRRHFDDRWMDFLTFPG